MQYLAHIKYPQTYILLDPSQNKMKNITNNKKPKSTVVGETIAFSICNKPFKPLGIP